MSYLIWPLLLLVIGLILLVTEAFIPSGGIIGLLAVGCLGVSLYQAFTVPDAPYLGWKFLAAELLLIPVALVVAVQLWPRTPLARRIILPPPTPEEVESAAPRHRLDHLVGEFGRALTPLRPSGLVDFDGRRLDGLAEDAMIPAGALVRAVRIHSGVLVVRKAEDDALRTVDV
jgi:membrane-bound ClpP family serine protease